MSSRKDRWLEEILSTKERRRKFHILKTIGLIWTQIALIVGGILFLLKAFNKI